MHQAIISATGIGMALANLAEELSKLGTDERAQRGRTVAVLLGSRLGIQIVAATSGLRVDSNIPAGRNFNAAQRGFLAGLAARVLEDGRFGRVHNASQFPRKHAEQKAIGFSVAQGIAPVVMGTSRNICGVCVGLIEATGGIVLNDRLAAWLF